MAKEMKKRKQTVDMTSGSITKPLILFILPIIGSGVLQLLYNTVDFIYVGNLLNKTSAAAVGASSTLIFCCIGLFSGIAVGTSVVVSQALGAHNGKDAGKALHTSIAFSLLGGAVLMLLAIAFAPEILKLLNTPGRAMEEAVAYMRIYMLSTPAMIYYNVCSGAIRAAGDSRTPFCILLLFICFYMPFHTIHASAGEVSQGFCLTKLPAGVQSGTIPSVWVRRGTAPRNIGNDNHVRVR